MNYRFGAALLPLVVLCACNNSDAKNGSANSGAVANSSAPAGPTATPAAPADPQLVNDVRMAADIIRPQLPIRQPNGVSITNVQAKGPELVLEMQVPTDIDQQKFSQMEQQLPVLACNNPQAMETFRRGGTYTYEIVDSEGERFTASVNRCGS